MTKTDVAPVGPQPTLNMATLAAFEAGAEVPMLQPPPGSPPGMPSLPQPPQDNRLVRESTSAVDRAPAQQQGLPSMEEFEQALAAVNGGQPQQQTVPAAQVQAPPPAIQPQAPAPAEIPPWAQQMLQQNQQQLAMMQQQFQALTAPPPAPQLTRQQEYQQLAQELQSQGIKPTAEVLVAARSHREAERMRAEMNQQFAQFQQFQQQTQLQAQWTNDSQVIGQMLLANTAPFADRIPKETKLAMAQQARTLWEAGYSPEQSATMTLQGYAPLFKMLPAAAVQQVVGVPPAPSNMQPQPQFVPAHQQTNPAAFAQQQQGMLAVATQGQGAGRQQPRMPTLEEVEAAFSRGSFARG